MKRALRGHSEVNRCGELPSFRRVRDSSTRNAAQLPYRNAAPLPYGTLSAAKESARHLAISPTAANNFCIAGVVEISLLPVGAILLRAMVTVESSPIGLGVCHSGTSREPGFFSRILLCHFSFQDVSISQASVSTLGRAARRRATVCSKFEEGPLNCAVAISTRASTPPRYDSD